MEQDSFVNAIRRFFARRGPIKRMWSDNGTNIVATERELREALQHFNEGEIRDTLSIQGIEWNFHPPHASHFGGVWERLIRSDRRALTAACLQQVMTDETLRTLFCEVEAVVSSQPLTKINDDPNCPAPLTPNMILTLKGSPDPSHPHECQKWSVPKSDINVGDVVLTLDEQLPRGSWPLGKVMEVTRSADGRVRQALIKTENGEFRRPVQKLCLLLENDKGDDIK
ncbi:uncharacterized protein [Palaemon carinicauda]|uniref:uncharacterized protein n=1 Tax=Palaemon carinicauda TaxID=392227 RepID=UPI0035B6194D